MAVNAESHFETVTLESVLGLHRTVALLTGKILSYVSLMIEQYVLRKIVHFFPRSGDLVVVVPVLLLDPGMVGDDVLVTVQALLHRRQSRVVGVAHIGMTVKALDPLDLNV